MMTDTQIITGRRSILNYLLNPVLRAKSEALTER
jgi:adhesin transport system membrane fusion protein